MRKNSIEQKAPQICSLYLNGKSFLEIAKITNTATISIQKILKANNIKSRPSCININKLKDKETILAALNKCNTIKQAAKLLGIDKSTLHAYIRRYSINKTIIIRWR